MAVVSKDLLLGDLLVDMARGLLQYVGESWPWAASDHEAARAQVESLVTEQQQDIRKLVDLMNRRDVPIEFGTYPDYSGLHYLDLATLLPVLIESHQATVERLNQTLVHVQDDQELKALLSDLYASASHQLSELRGIRGK